MDQPAGTMVANSVQVRRESIARTIWLTRPDIRHLAGNDRSRFEAWLVLWGILEYRALVETESETGILDALLLPAPEACFGVEPQLTRLMTEVRNLRVDLKEKFSISSPDGQQEYAWWCVLDGAQQPEAWFSRIRAICEKQGLLTNPADVAYSDTAPVLTRFAHLVWRMRDDLQAAFDLKSEASRQDFMWWFFWFGSCEHRFDRYLTNEQLRFVHGPAEDIPTGNEPMPVSRLMARVWAQRPDLQNSFPLNADVSRAQFIAWFYAVGMEELQLTGLIDRHLAGALLEEVSPEVRVSRIGALLWVHSGMLRKKFPMPGAAEFSEWLRGEGACEFPLLKRLQDFSSSSAAAAPGIVKSSRSDHRGFNLIGYARGQFGIGEDVRMAAEAMKAAKVPFSIFNIEPGKEVSQDDASADCHISPDLPYGINLFCTTGIETARLAAVEGSRLFDGRLSIGAWPWELPEWPANWHHAYELVDEVWASSRYTQEAYLKSSPKSVLYMPMAVTVGLGAGHDRRYFGLPDNRFLFTFSFDALSGFARKNPWAVIRAFRKAFPNGDEPVGLVLKVMRAEKGQGDWDRFSAEAAEDPRIMLLNRTLSRAEILDLYRACDCFVSLHRAEGYGRGIAEAMLLGKPVITTGFSGNLDFTTNETAALVGYELVPVKKGEYPFADGQVWADVDIEHAARSMKRIAGDAAFRRQLAGAGQSLVSRNLAPSAIGRRYRGMLDRLLPG